MNGVKLKYNKDIIKNNQNYLLFMLEFSNIKFTSIHSLNKTTEKRFYVQIKITIVIYLIEYSIPIEM